MNKIYKYQEEKLNITQRYFTLLEKLDYFFIIYF